MYGDFYSVWCKFVAFFLLSRKMQAFDYYLCVGTVSLRTLSDAPSFELCAQSSRVCFAIAIKIRIRI